MCLSYQRSFKMAKLTRNSDSVLGICNEFSKNMFPTKLEIIKQFFFLQRKVKNVRIPKEEFIKATTQRVKEIWSKTDISIIEDRSIEKKVKSVIEKYSDLMKYVKKQDFGDRVNKFQEMKELFDIAYCKCEQNERCHCPYENKIPSHEKEFLSDQRNNRVQILGSVDVRASRKAERKLKRINKNNIAPIPNKKLTNRSCASIVKRDNAITLNTTRIPLTNVAREIQRLVLSSQQASTVLNAFMKDVDVADEDNMIDKNQIDRNILSKYAK